MLAHVGDVDKLNLCWFAKMRLSLGERSFNAGPGVRQTVQFLCQPAEGLPAE